VAMLEEVPPLAAAIERPTTPCASASLAAPERSKRWALGVLGRAQVAVAVLPQSQEEPPQQRPSPIVVKCEVEEPRSQVRPAPLQRKQSRRSGGDGSVIKRRKVKLCKVKLPLKAVEMVKHEPGRRFGFARAPEDHYRFQVAFINTIVRPPWHLCFGNLGTGFVGVRQTTSTSVDSGDDAQGKGEVTMIIFINSPASALQSRAGKAIGGYQGQIDATRRTLEWSAQRNDKNNKKVQALIDHIDSGGRLVVGVRGDKAGHFKCLGDAKRMVLTERAQFLVEAGDHVLQELGTNTFHKAITASCLSPFLRQGVGLVAARYPLRSRCRPRWCTSCCYMPPRALLHFDELVAEGVTAFSAPPQGKRERVIVKSVKAEPSASPVKRLRFKQPIIKVEGAEVPHVPMKLERKDES